MNLKQLEAFVKVAETKSFSEAAKQLLLTQPTISAHVSALEKELNTCFLIRNTRGVEEYCDDCPEFDAHVEKEVLFAGYSKKYCNTNITCEHKDKCKRLKDMIEKEAKKRND